MYYKNNVLLLEDNPADVELTRLAFQDLPQPLGLHHFSNGEDFLLKLGDIIPEQVACLILDLNVPKIHGFEVLRKLRAQIAFKNLPVVVFSSSSLQEDITASYAAGADAYVVKPSGFDEFCESIHHIVYQWALPGMELLERTG